MYFIVNFDIAPGKVRECDYYIREKIVPFCNSTKEINSVKVLEDMFIGWPERSIILELDSLSSLQKLMSTDEIHGIKEEFSEFITGVQSQVMTESSYK